MMLLRVFRLLVAVAAFSVGVPLLAQDTFTRSNPKFVAAFKSSVQTASKSTARILCNGQRTALGVVVGADGLILTKANDLHGYVGVDLGDGVVHDAETVGIHQGHDLALLRIDVADLTPIKFVPTKNVAAGAWLASAAPGGEVATFGVIGVPTRNVSQKGSIADPSKSPYLGVSLETADEGAGVKISGIVPGTPAEKIGLLPGDVIVALSGAAVDSDKEFTKVLAKYHPGDLVTLRIRRGDGLEDYSVFLERRPLGSFRGEMQNRMGSELSSRRTGYAMILQHDGVVRPSDCGGPIVDLEGRVLGLNICRAGRTESWALPTEAILPVLPLLKSGKLAPKSAKAVSRELAEHLAKAKSTLAKAEEAGDANTIKAARIGVESAQAEIDGHRSADAIAAAERLLNRMRNRLLVMNDVALWKAAHHLPIHDAKREQELLDHLVSQASSAGVAAADITRFFTAQFEAARALQQAKIDAWKKDGVEPAATRDLHKELRPRIEKLNDALLASLAEIATYRKAEPKIDDHLRRREPEVLTGTGISDRVRNLAVGGLNKP
jgi:serine protease Do